MIDEKREQVAKQFEVVAHLATVLAGVHSDIVKVIRDGHMDDSLDRIGDRSAAWMERLGDMLNVMDGVDEEDVWTNPVFEAAHRLFPQEP